MDIVSFFKKNQPNYEPEPNVGLKEVFKPIYGTSDLKPPFLDEGEYEMAENQQYRFSNLHPVTVLCEVANAIDGEVTRKKPFDKYSAPIVIKKLKNINISIIFHKNQMCFIVYQNLFFDDPMTKLITSRKTIYGIQKAIEMIENGDYDKVLNK